MCGFGVYPDPEDMVGVFDLWPLYPALLNYQLLAKSKVFQNYVLLAPEDKSEQLIDER
jgi:hypothetical protein